MDDLILSIKLDALPSQTTNKHIYDKIRKLGLSIPIIYTDKSIFRFTYIYLNLSTMQLITPKHFINKSLDVTDKFFDLTKDNLKEYILHYIITNEIKIWVI